MAVQTLDIADKTTLDATKTNVDLTKANTEEILAAVAGGSSAIKSVQRGYSSVTGSSSTYYSIVAKTININSVNANKSVVLLNSFLSFENVNSGDRPVILTSFSSTSFSIMTRLYSDSLVEFFSWQVIEFN